MSLRTNHTAEILHRSSLGQVNASHKLGMRRYKYVCLINFHRMLAPIAYNRLNPQIKCSNALLIFILRHYLLILDAVWSFEIMNPIIAIPTKPETNSTEANVMIAPKKVLVCCTGSIVAIFVGLIMIPIPMNNIVTNMMNRITSRSKAYIKT